MQHTKHIIAIICSTAIFLGTALYAAPEKTATAIFAGGCFWSMQHDFAKVAGIVKTTVGYTGGNVANPTYEQVSNGDTGHYEAIEIVYDPKIISYAQLLNFYWHDTDPTNADGQFCDRGNEYHPVIFYENAKQQQIAMTSKQQLSQSNALKGPVVTQILPAKTFYPAEDYHQQYSDKNPDAYAAYRSGCRRDSILNEVWGK
jgi:peptide-methionine (S)-S-oxide reductase